MTPKGIKRFYKAAAAAETAGGFAIHLDGKPVKTPCGRTLVIPGPALAEAVAREWAEQDTTVRPDRMPLTQLAATALDRVGPERATITAQLMNYAGTDLLCYRADFPPDLALRQQDQWQPLLDWAAAALGAPLAVTQGIIAIAQPDTALAALAAQLDQYDPWRLTAVQAACAAAGSLVLALAMAEARIDAAAAFALSQLDETYQIEQWGEDDEARARRTALARDIDAAARLLTLI